MPTVVRSVKPSPLVLFLASTQLYMVTLSYHTSY